MSTKPRRRTGTAPSATRACARAVFLVGFMGAGKTSVGLELSRQLGRPFEDLDDRIVAREGRTIEQIFEESGEAAFREAERSALRALITELDPARPMVVALGGGAFAQSENRALLEEAGFAVIFLDAPVEELFRRCQQQTRQRPMRRDPDQFRRLYETRRPAYSKAWLRIDTVGMSIGAVAAEAVRALTNS